MVRITPSLMPLPRFGKVTIAHEDDYNPHHRPQLIQDFQNARHSLASIVNQLDAEGIHLNVQHHNRDQSPPQSVTIDIIDPHQRPLAEPVVGSYSTPSTAIFWLATALGKGVQILRDRFETGEGAPKRLS